MRLLYYLYQVKLAYINFVYAHKSAVSLNDNVKCTAEENVDWNTSIKFNCARAVQKIQCMNKFTYWPMTEVKKEKIKDKNTLVSLSINDNKAITFEPNKMMENQSIKRFNTLINIHYSVVKRNSVQKPSPYK